MAFKSVQCRASQSSSFGHLELSPRTSVTITPNCSPLHSAPTRIMPNHSAVLHTAAVDKALDIWYTIGVGVKETHKTGTKK